MIVTNQKHPRFDWEVCVIGFDPLPCRTRSIAELIRKKFVRKYGTLDVTIRERKGR